MDRSYADPLAVRAVAAVAHLSEGHFIRSFRAAFGETPHRYLQRRRVERSMFLLRETDCSVTDICFDVGFTSRGTFSRTFREIVGEPPSDYRVGPRPRVGPNGFQLWAARPGVGGGAGGGAQLLPAVGDAAGGGGGGGAAIEQFWRRRSRGGSLASGSFPSTLAKEKTSDDHQTQRRLHHGPQQGRGS